MYFLSELASRLYSWFYSSSVNFLKSITCHVAWYLRTVKPSYTHVPRTFYFLSPISSSSSVFSVQSFLYASIPPFSSIALFCSSTAAFPMTAVTHCHRAPSSGPCAADWPLSRRPPLPADPLGTADPGRRRPLVAPPRRPPARGKWSMHRTVPLSALEGIVVQLKSTNIATK